MSNRFPVDDEHLHKYPGNLKHHKVEPLLDHQDGYTCASFFGKECDCDVNIYEAARAKDAELIQRLVDGLQQIADEGHWTPDMHKLLNAAAAAGFKPSEP